jgi:3-oxoadipate enol-lactonase
VPQVVQSGCHLNYCVDGDSRREPLLFSNSLGTTHELWGPQVDALSSRFRIIRYDTRGHGASDAPRGEYTIEQLGLDAIAILDAVGVERAHVCGLSLGGLTAMWLGVNAPERVCSLTLSSTAARIGSVSMWTERIKEVNANGVASLADAAMGRWFTAGYRAAHADIVAVYHRMLGATPADGYVGCCAAIRDADLREAIKTVAAPTLVIAGREDPVTPPSDAEDMRARIDGARVEILDAAHIANVEQAQVYNDLVSSFITEISRSVNG